MSQDSILNQNIEEEEKDEKENDKINQPPRKLFKSENGDKINKRFQDFDYLLLKSGKEFIFTENDGKNILLNSNIEPNKLLRNIISRIPNGVKDRLIYLAQFNSEEDEESNIDVLPKYDGNLHDRVFESYIREWRLRSVFKKLLVAWRLYVMNKSSEKELDPITLSPPEKEVAIYDWTNKKKFIFDAKSLAILIETQLKYQEHGFPLPIYPRNPKNNITFLYKQLVSIYNQLKDMGELRWGLVTLREVNFNNHKWQMYNRSALTIHAIKVSISLLDGFEARDLFSDFIFAKMDDLGIKYNNYVYNIYQVAMALVPRHWYLEKLKSMAILHYEAEHFGHNKDKFINTACLKIFKHQLEFIQDLKNKKII